MYRPARHSLPQPLQDHADPSCPVPSIVSCLGCLSVLLRRQAHE